MKDINRRVDTMSNEQFEKLEIEMKAAFHKHNMGISRIAKRAISRSNIYINEPKMLWNGFKKFLSWV